MFKCLDIVMHPGMGVCKIEEIKKQTILNFEKEFYVLRPIYENEKTLIYVPIDSEKIKLRKLLTKNDVKEIIRALPKNESLWIENDIKRKEVFSQIIKGGDHVAIMSVIHTLHNHRIQKELSGKRLHLNDEKLLNEAEKIIHQELAYTMNIKPDEVTDFIIAELNKLK